MRVRHTNFLDTFIIETDKAIKTLFGRPETTARPTPSDALPESNLSSEEQSYSTRLMRINHAGEVSAQALYQGQALTANLPKVRLAMEQAAIEENDHLVWCQQRIKELGGHTSVFNPLWYVGSFAIGAAAGKLGDKWSLGFVAETEKQVVHHLDEHLSSMSEQDCKSRAILEQMKIDELHHGTIALEAGGVELPQPVTLLMGVMSKVMTKSSYYL